MLDHFLISLPYSSEVGNVITSILQIEKLRLRQGRLLLQAPESSHLLRRGTGDWNTGLADPVACPPHDDKNSAMSWPGSTETPWQDGFAFCLHASPPTSSSSSSSSRLSVSVYLERLGTEVQGPQI